MCLYGTWLLLSLPYESTSKHKPTCAISTEVSCHQCAERTTPFPRSVRRIGYWRVVSYCPLSKLCHMVTAIVGCMGLSLCTSRYCLSAATGAEINTLRQCTYKAERSKVWPIIGVPSVEHTHVCSVDTATFLPSIYLQRPPTYLLVIVRAQARERPRSVKHRADSRLLHIVAARAVFLCRTEGQHHVGVGRSIIEITQRVCRHLIEHADQHAQNASC